MRDVLAATVALHEGNIQGVTAILQGVDKTSFFIHALSLLAQQGMDLAGGEEAWLQQQRKVLLTDQLMGVGEG